MPNTPLKKIDVAEHVRLDFEAARVEYGIEDTPHNFRVFAAGIAISAVTLDMYVTNPEMRPLEAESATHAVDMYVDRADTVANTPI